MDVDASAEPVSDPAAENERLRRRIAQLEDELAEQAARAIAAVAAAQERSYWLDRWHLDLNATMARPWAGRARAAVRALRAPVRWARRAGRGLRGG